ncbi:hypothetical protein [Nocardia sp. 348MFTsu5.1]|uniref:hypothetical protein n=1 Tax=Nocardia sp. 348MFTsu5.1 TaxID=1172185 RepID=UPI00037E45EA|nr:hypothetical protein [Nocardia sp. 348MFTsu5.1]
MSNALEQDVVAAAPRTEAAPREGVLLTVAGLGLAATGIAHFVSPKLFEPITKPAFPENTTRWTYTNGASETLIGLAIANKRTRRFGYIGLVGYLGFLASRVI